MDIEKTTIRKEAVNRMGKGGAEPENSPEGVGSRPKVGDCAQVFKRVALFLKRVGFIGGADQLIFSATSSTA